MQKDLEKSIEIKIEDRASPVNMQAVSDDAMINRGVVELRTEVKSEIFRNLQNMRGVIERPIEEKLSNVGIELGEELEDKLDTKLMDKLTIAVD